MYTTGDPLCLVRFDVFSNVTSTMPVCSGAAPASYAMELKKSAKQIAIGAI
jgi:hypothetical protein